MFGWLVNSLMSKVMPAFLAGGGCLEPARIEAVFMCLGIGGGLDCGIDGCLLALELLLLTGMGVWGGEGPLVTCPPFLKILSGWFVCLGGVVLEVLECIVPVRPFGNFDMSCFPWTVGVLK